MASGGSGPGAGNPSIAEQGEYVKKRINLLSKSEKKHIVRVLYNAHLRDGIRYYNEDLQNRNTIFIAEKIPEIDLLEIYTYTRDRVERRHYNDV